MIYAAPGSLVLTSDLRWIPVETLKVGQRLLSLEESTQARRQRRWEWSSVTFVSSEKRECFEVLLSNGEVLIATEDHPWLTGVMGQCWVPTRNLNYRAHKTVLPRLLKLWEPNKTYESGWLAGFFDGEGYITLGRQCGLQVAAHQKFGPVADQAMHFVVELGFGYRTTQQRDLVKIHITGGTAETMRFLGTVRPVRLIGRLVANDTLPSIRRYRDGENLRILSITPNGEREMISFRTTNNTCLINGFASLDTERVSEIKKRQKEVAA